MKQILLIPVKAVQVIWQSVWVALSQIGSNKVRSILTTLGIIIGIASVSGVIGSLSGLKAKMVSDFETFGINNLYLGPRRPNTGPLKNASGELIRFSPAQIEGMLQHCPSVKTFTRVTSYRGLVAAGDRTVEGVNVNCVDASWLNIEGRNLLQGWRFSPVEESQGRRVCLIDPSLRDKLHLDKECVGQFITLNNMTYRIAGIVEEKTSTSFINANEGENFEIIIPFMTRYHEAGNWLWFHVIASSQTAEVVDEAKAEITFFLRRTRRQNPGDPDSFWVKSVTGELEQFNKIMGTVTAVAGGIVGISLIVGGVGIMNIMLVSVAERTREIGLRKAVGAKSTSILAQFLIEAVVLCCTGGVVGLGFGYLIIQGIRKIPNANLDQAYIPGWAILLSFIFSAAVGIFFGVFPAIKAARLNPIEALRNE